MSFALEISIGPVQGFVAQARRTRDLWAGSFLLSFLAGHAMRGAREGDGTLTRPAENVLEKDPLFQWINGKTEGEPPRIGTLPNHFVIDCPSEEVARTAAIAAREAFDNAWKKVADAVWAGFVAPVQNNGVGVADIWKRQTEGFWEFLWVAAPEDQAKGLLAQRKHWRTHQLPEEPGDKCQIIPDLQELSGHTRFGASAEQREFWYSLRTQSNLKDLDIDENERLCSIALIKRLLPKVSEQAIGWRLDANHWPSTDYVAAVPWLRRAIDFAPNDASAYVKRVERAAKSWKSGHGNRFTLGENPIVTVNPDWYDLSALANPDVTKLKIENDETRRELRREVKKLFEHPADSRTLGPPSSYYAVLLADGDRMGQLAGTLEKTAGSKSLSDCLADFSDKAIQSVAGHDGVVVYAGGDDLLAFLPIESALRCADEIAQTFSGSFGEESKATLSAAVVFAHVRAPLRSVLARAHKLLDDEAKEANGRNSLAAAVYGRAAEQVRWVTCWKRNGARAVEQIDHIVVNLRKDAEDGDVGLSSSLVYRLREGFARLIDLRWRPGAPIELPEGLEAEPLIRAEVAHSLSKRDDAASEQEANKLTSALQSVTAPVRGDSDKQDSEDILLDGWFLAQFLAGGGREAEHL